MSTLETNQTNDEYAFFGKLTKYEKSVVDKLRLEGLSDIQIAECLAEL